MDLNKLSFLSYDYFTPSFPYQVPEHYHPYFELVYYISGEGYGEIDNVKYNYHAGSFVVIKPFSKHLEVSTKESKITTITFRCTGLDLIYANTILSDSSDSSVLVALNQIKDEYANEAPLFQEKIALIIGNILIDIYRKNSIEIKEEKSDIIVLKKYLDEKFLDDIDYEYLSSKVFYSYDYLRHYFKKETGMSMKQYILLKKIEYSKNLLIEGYSIKDIAQKCRFSSPSHFISAFKSATNQTPLEFKSYLQK